MKEFEIEIAGEEVAIKVASNDEDRKKGLSGLEEIDHGMLFVFPYTGEHKMWMKDTKVPLDILFINEKGVITQILSGEPDNSKLIGDSEDTRYVLELPSPMASEEGLKKGDILPIPVEVSVAEDEEEAPSASLLDEDGNPQMDIRGGERVFSRPKTVEIIGLAKSATSKEDLLKLGRLVAEEIEAQDGREEEYVDPDKTKHQYAKEGAKLKETPEKTKEYVSEEVDRCIEVLFKKKEENQVLSRKISIYAAFELYKHNQDCGDLYTRCADEKVERLYADLTDYMKGKDENEDTISCIEDISTFIIKFIRKEEEEKIEGTPVSELLGKLEELGYSISKDQE